MRKYIVCLLVALFITTPLANVLAKGTNYRYTGQERDPSSNLYYYGRRYYQPEVGRFTQPDPVSKYLTNPQKLKQATGQDLQKFLENPQKLNDYSYTINNPVKYTDPNGEQIEAALPVISEGAVVVAAVGTAVIVAVTPLIIKAAEKVGEGIVAMVDSITTFFSRSDGELIKKIDSFDKPIQEHLDKLNKGDPSSRNPRNRKDWKKHIEKALNNMRKVAEKIKNKEKREKQIERIEKTRDEINQMPIVVPEVDKPEN